MQTAVVMLLVATSAVLGLYLTEIQVPQNFARWVMDLTSNKYAVLALLNCGLFVIGMFLHGAAAIILVVPIVMPLINQIGIDKFIASVLPGIKIGCINLFKREISR